VGRAAALGVVPAQMLHVGARNAHIAQGHGRGSSHESFHDRRAHGLPRSSPNVAKSRLPIGRARQWFPVRDDAERARVRSCVGPWPPYGQGPQRPVARPRLRYTRRAVGLLGRVTARD
jgi:hypothetical protein